MEAKFLSVVIPVYNPGIDRIRNFLACLCAELERICEGQPYEVIVVNDASRDDVREVLERLEKDFESIKLFSFAANRGQQYALDYGIMKAAAVRCVLMDDDQEAFFDCLGGFIDELDKGYDIVIGRRQFRYVRRWRMSGSRFVNALVSLAIGHRVHDMGGVKVFGPDAVSLLKERGGFLSSLKGFRSLKLQEIVIPVKVNPLSRYNAWKLFKLFSSILIALLGLRSKINDIEH